MAIPLRANRRHEVKRAVELRVVDHGLSVEQRVQALVGGMVRLLQGGDTHLDRVLNADIPNGCIELLVTSSSMLYVEDTKIEVRIRRWPR